MPHKKNGNSFLPGQVHRIVKIIFCQHSQNTNRYDKIPLVGFRVRLESTTEKITLMANKNGDALSFLKLIDEFSDLVAELEKEKIPYALCGGLAMAVHAFPRATMDIDVLIEPETLSKVKEIAERLGFVFDMGLMKFSDGKIQIYRLTKIPDNSIESLMLDMLLLTDEIRDVWESRQILSWRNGNIPVVSAKGLIKLKAIRSSGQDLDDIEKLKGIIDNES